LTKFLSALMLLPSPSRGALHEASGVEGDAAPAGRGGRTSCTRVVEGHRPAPLRGSAAMARLDVVRVKAAKAVGWHLLRCAQYPEERSFDQTERRWWRAVRRCAVGSRRRSGLSLLRPTYHFAPCGVPLPLMVGEATAHPSDAPAPRDGGPAT